MDSNNLLLWPLVLYAFIVIALVAAMVGASAVLGPRHREAATGDIYESGIVSTGSAHVRFAAKFYLMAMLFVIFDLEAVFIYAYAVAYKGLGFRGYAEVLVFIGVLVAALVYLWRNGALDWGPSARMKKARPAETI